MERPSFLQDSPRLGNQFLEDSALISILTRVLPKDVFDSIKPDLERFGDRVIGEVLQNGRESEANPPQLFQYNAWGRRIDEIKVAPGWNRLKDIAAEEGLVAIGYERKAKQWSRLYQGVKLYLFHSSSCVFTCPLAMTDGAARLLEVWGAKDFGGENGPYARLTSRNPKHFWTSGQWMTEKTGGSDVGNSETIAKKGTDGVYRVYGFKFFTSAITSEMTLMLARVVDEEGKSKPGSAGLSVFYVETHNKDGELNNIEVHKLKHKLGTRAVPTAELELKGSTAKLIGPANRGIPVISSILNITRIHNAIASISTMKRGIAVARDYAHRRKVFGKTLAQQPLHLATLSELEVQFRGSLQFLIDVLIIQGKSECKVSSKEEEILLRFLTPLLKLFTGKASITVSSESIECLGGTGYMEDSDMPRLLRVDIWRAMKKEQSLEVFAATVLNKLSKIKNQQLSSSVKLVQDAVNSIQQIALKFSGLLDKDLIEATARQFAFSLARIYIAPLLLEHAEWSGDAVDVEVARRWCTEQPLVWVVQADEGYRNLSRSIALDIDSKTNTARGTGNFNPNGSPRARY